MFSSPATNSVHLVLNRCGTVPYMSVQEECTHRLSDKFLRILYCRIAGSPEDTLQEAGMLFNNGPLGSGRDYS